MFGVLHWERARKVSAEEQNPVTWRVDNECTCGAKIEAERSMLRFQGDRLSPAGWGCSSLRVANLSIDSDRSWTFHDGA